VKGSRIRDEITVPGTDSSIILLDIQFEEGAPETYLFTVARSGWADAPDDSVIARLDGDILYDALWNRKFSDALLSAIADDATFPGDHSRLTTCHTTAFERIVGTNHPKLPAKVSK